MSIYNDFSSVAGSSWIQSGGGSIPFIEVGASAAVVYADAGGAPSNDAIGMATTYSIGIGGNPVNVGMAKCFTELGEVTNDVLPDVPTVGIKVSVCDEEIHQTQSKPLAPSLPLLYICWLPEQHLAIHDVLDGDTCVHM